MGRRFRSKSEFLKELEGMLDLLDPSGLLLDFCQSCAHGEECFKSDFQLECSLNNASVSEFVRKIKREVLTSVKELVMKSKFKPK